MNPFLFFLDKLKLQEVYVKTTILLTWSLVSLVLCYNPNNVHLVSYDQKEDKIIGVLIFFFLLYGLLYLSLYSMATSNPNKWFCSMMLNSCLTTAEWLTTKSFIFLWHCTFISATEDVCLFVDKQDQLPPNLHHPMFVLFLLTKSDLKIQIRFLSLCFLSILDYVFPVFCEDAYSAPFSSTIILYRLTSFLREAVWITLLCKMGGLLIPSLWVTVHCCRNLLVWIHRV